MKKFLPLGTILFCFLFNHTILRDTKDTLVVNAGGAALIPFLRGTAGLLAISLFVVLYMKFVKNISREKLFYMIIVPFIFFFGIFGFLIHPNVDFFHPAKETIAALHTKYPALTALIDVYAYWTYSLFYVLAELWGSVVCAFGFWEFANHIFSFSEAKRYYGLFAIIANVALITSGYIVYFCSESIKYYVPAGTDPWQLSIYLLMSIVVLMGGVAVYVYHGMHKGVLKDMPSFDSLKLIDKKYSAQIKPAAIKNKSIILSPELALISVVIVLSCVVMNLIEIQWKEQLKLFYAGDKGGYNGFMGMFSMATGSFSILFMIFGIFILRKFTWFTAAVIVPAVILICGSLFFTFIVSKDVLQPLLDFFNLKFNAVSVFLGAGAILLSKSGQYALFGPTKEMAYIPLDPELKSKGKAIVDLIGGRLGKAGSAWVSMGLLMASTTKDVVAIAPYAFGIFTIVCIVWIYAVKALSKKIETAVNLNKSEHPAD